MKNQNSPLVIGLLILSMVLLVFARESKADCDEIYFKVGAGYKAHETTRIIDRNKNIVMNIEPDPISARIETGVDCGKWSYGISHHSQWRTGFPFNDQKEMHKTEFFIDYKLSWGI